MDYFETNLNMGIAFRASYAYTFPIPAHILIFTNWKFGFDIVNN